MRKLAALLLALTMLFTLCACGASADTAPAAPLAELKVGDKISLPFAEITVASAGADEKVTVPVDESSSISFGGRKGYTLLNVCLKITGTESDLYDEDFKHDVVTGIAVINGKTETLIKNKAGTEDTVVCCLCCQLPLFRNMFLQSCDLYFGFNEDFAPVTDGYDSCTYRYKVTVK